MSEIRSIQTEVPFVMPVAVPFTNTANEPALVYTEPPLAVGESAVEILGMMTDITGATGLFSINGDATWSSDQIPLAVNFGAPGSAKPIVWLERPLTIVRGQRIRGDLVNVGGVGAGTLYFIGRQKGVNAPRVSLPDDVGVPDSLILDSGFTGTADERPARVTSPVLEEDFLVWGMHTNLNNATVRLFGIDGVPWSEVPVNVWAIAGRAADATSTLRLHKPYLIPAKAKIGAEFVNGAAPDVDAAGQLILKGLRFPALHSQGDAK